MTICRTNKYKKLFNQTSKLSNHYQPENIAKYLRIIHIRL